MRGRLSGHDTGVSWPVGAAREGARAVRRLPRWLQGVQHPESSAKLRARGRGRAGDVVALRETERFPCIIFWNFNHFVVRVDMEEFEESFTGVVLIFEKTDAFVESGKKPSTLRYAKERLAGMEVAIAFVMLSAAIASLVGIANTSLSRVFMDRILTGENPDWLGPIIACLLILAAITGVVSVLNAIYLVRIRGKIAVVSSSRFMRHLLHLPVGFYSQRMIGDLQQGQSSNETIAFALIGQMAPVVINVIMLVLYLVVMLRYSLLLLKPACSDRI